MTEMRSAMQSACGCCAGLEAATPLAIDNRAGLSAVAYRIGTQPEFKASLLARLSSSDYPQLAKVLTRDDDDFSIALLDAWAGVADVLGFYQERIANESYLRTATERLSVLELARLIGYRPRPGVAAETVLAFTVEEAPGAPQKVMLSVGLQVQSVPGQDEKPQTFETTQAIEARAAWNALKPRSRAPHVPTFGRTDVYLAGIDLNLKAGDALLFVGKEREDKADDEHWDFRIIKSVALDVDNKLTHVIWEEGLGSIVPRMPPAQEPKVYVFRRRAAVFGHNAPRWKSMPTEFKNNYAEGGASLSEWPNFKIGPSANKLDLDTVVQQIVPDSWVVLSKPDYQELYRILEMSETSRAEFAISGKVSRLKLSGENLEEKKFATAVREITVFAVSEKLEMAEKPRDDAVSGESIELDAAVEGLEAGRLLAISGKDADGKDAAEIVTLLRAEAAGKRSRLVLAPPGLAGSYQRSTVRINANVAPANHGETVHQILGGGNAGDAHQRFELRHAPLTWTSADNPAGAASTLQVQVNDVRWHEADTLFSRGGDERLYTIRSDDGGKSVVQFGDGRRGARLPTGQDNVRAVYRKGIGLAGNVEPGKLTTLLTRPLGLKEVTNPRAASGGDDAEKLDDARRNAPLTVLTLERVVSLLDYQDFARAFSGIAKALAVWLPEHGARSVFITIAGPKGAPVAESDKSFVNLVEALKKAGDPYVRVSLKTYRPATFRLAAKVKRHPDHGKEKIFAAVEQALREAFSFEAREFGQPVQLSEVVAVMQRVDGVLAVDIDALYRGAKPGRKERLDADLPYVDNKGNTLAAELLTLASAPLDTLQEMP